MVYNGFNQSFCRSNKLIYSYSLSTHYNKASLLSVSLSTSQSVTGIQVKGKWPDIKRLTNIKKTVCKSSKLNSPVSTFFLHLSLIKSRCFRFIVHKYTGASQKRSLCLNSHKLNPSYHKHLTQTPSLTSLTSY